MTEPLPRWVMQRYSKLWSEFASDEFEHADALKVLNGDNMVSIVLAALRKAGWMEVKLSSEDLRKRKYQLKNPEKAVLEISQNALVRRQRSSAG